MSAVTKLEPMSQGIATLTPMDIVDRALQSGNVDAFAKAMDLYERWEKNQASKEFNEAVTAAKAKIKPIARNKAGHNGKRYADMAAVSAAIDPILSEHGLGYRFRSTQDERINVTCILFHRSGHQEETTLCGPADTSGSKNAIQAIGSTTTYLERYTLMLALGLSAGEDDDGKMAGDGEKISDGQFEELKSLIVKVGADIAKFCAIMKIEKVEELPAKRFEEAKTRLNKFAQQQKGGDK